MQKYSAAYLPTHTLGWPPVCADRVRLLPDPSADVLCGEPASVSLRLIVVEAFGCGGLLICQRVFWTGRCVSHCLPFPLCRADCPRSQSITVAGVRSILLMVNDGFESLRTCVYDSVSSEYCNDEIQSDHRLQAVVYSELVLSEPALASRGL